MLLLLAFQYLPKGVYLISRALSFPKSGLIRPENYFHFWSQSLT